MLLTLLLSAVLSLPSLPSGDEIPHGNASCNGSDSHLGTSDLGGDGSGSRDTTVVNIWSIEQKTTGNVRGFLVKTHDGQMWFEPDVPFRAFRVTNDDIRLLQSFRDYEIKGCFARDLPM